MLYCFPFADLVQDMLCGWLACLLGMSYRRRHEANYCTFRRQPENWSRRNLGVWIPTLLLIRGLYSVPSSFMHSVGPKLHLHSGSFFLLKILDFCFPCSKKVLLNYCGVNRADRPWNSIVYVLCVIIRQLCSETSGDKGTLWYSSGFEVKYHGCVCVFQGEWLHLHVYVHNCVGVLTLHIFSLG